MKRWGFLTTLFVLLISSTAVAQSVESQRKLMEDAFVSRMKEMSGDNVLERVSLDSTILSMVESGDYYISPGDTYVIDEISSATYYSYNGMSFEPLCSKAFPRETIANRLLLSNRELPDGDVNLRIQKYKYETDSICLKFKQLVSFCKCENFNAYVGFEESDAENMRVDLYLYNYENKWLHVITLDCPVNEVADDGLSINGNAWLFIPTSNLKELMGKNLPDDFMKKLSEKYK